MKLKTNFTLLEIILSILAIGIIGLFAVLVYSNEALAKDPHHYHGDNVIKQFNTTNINNFYEESGIARVAAMTGLKMDITNDSLQIGIGWGWNEDAKGQETDAWAIGIGQRICFDEERRHCGLINGAYSEGEAEGKTVNAAIILTPFN
jgi:hypothetical protein